mmetsp:Transcript_70166/g.164623  ORF Transcript_70166/g.164623 Transcript_70166/m.164623 type:complete len:234 (-) Transcript_70166:179-880(-)
MANRSGSDMEQTSASSKHRKAIAQLFSAAAASPSRNRWCDLHKTRNRLSLSAPSGSWLAQCRPFNASSRKPARRRATECQCNTSQPFLSSFLNCCVCDNALAVQFLLPSSVRKSVCDGNNQSFTNDNRKRTPHGETSSCCIRSAIKASTSITHVWHELISLRFSKSERNLSISRKHLQCSRIRPLVLTHAPGTKSTTARASSTRLSCHKDLAHNSYDDSSGSRWTVAALFAFS